MNLVGPILNHARTRPEAPALVEGDRTIDYRELASLVARTAGHLALLGVGPGGRVGVCLRDTAAHLVCLLAVARIGAVSVPLDWRARAAENTRIVQGLDLNRVLAEPDARLDGDCPVAILDTPWHRAVAMAEPAGAFLTDWNDPFAIMPTSGSTGTPKFTAISHLSCFFRIAGGFELMRLAGRHRYLSTAPLCHASAQTRALRTCCGATASYFIPVCLPRPSMSKQQTGKEPPSGSSYPRCCAGC